MIQLGTAPIFFGTKRVIALPMNRLEYNMYRGWELPANEDPADSGYLVEYTDGGKPNDERHKGYISWSPAEQFEAAYQPIHALDFGHALAAMKTGERVRRAGWNGKGMWLIIVGASEDEASRPFYDVDMASYGLADEIQGILPWIGMRTADAQFVPWLASQTDMLANDWQVIVE